MGSFDGFLVGLHHVKQLLAHRVSIITRVATIEAILADLPRRHALELHFDKAADFILADIGGETVGKVVEDLGIFGQDDGGAADFLDDGGDNILLVLDAVAIAGGI